MDKIYILEEWNKGAEEWLARRGYFLTEDEALKSAGTGSLVRVRTYEGCAILPGPIIQTWPPKEPRYRFEFRDDREALSDLCLVTVLDMLAYGERGGVSVECA